MEKEGAQDSYYSVAYWLNPEKVGKRESENPYETLFLGADILFDIDGDGINVREKIEDAKQKMEALLEEVPFEINYLLFSGAKGFHLSCRDPTDYSKYGTPEERENKALDYRIELYEKFKDFGIDEKVLKDTRRIVRVPFTYNWKTGMMAVPLNPEFFRDWDVSFLLSNVPKINRSLFRAMRLLRLPENRAPSYEGAFYSHAISSTLPKKPGYHVLIAQISSPKQTVIKECYGIFKVFDKYYLMSPVPRPYKEIIMLLEKLKAKNLNAFLKYRHALMPIGELYNGNFDVVGRVELIKKEGCNKGSKWHLRLLGKDGGEDLGVIYRMVRIRN